MKKTTGEIYRAYQIMVQSKMKGMDTDKAWALIMLVSDLKKVCAAYDSTREQAVTSLKPEDWDEKLPKVQEAENPSSDMSDEERKELIAYRNEFQSAINAVLEKEWAKEVEIGADDIDADTLKSYYKCNDFTTADVLFLLEFFGCVSPS